MGIRNWLGLKSKDDPDVVGTSSGGSRLIKYRSGNSEISSVDFSGEATEELAQCREAIYTEFFGAIDIAHHDLPALIPHIDVYRIPPTAKRPFYTFLTGGMSDLPMTAPEEFGSESHRIELVFYADSDNPEYPNLLRQLAHFPHDNHSWLHWGHTMPNGAPPYPLFNTRALDSLYFIESVVAPDYTLGQRLVWKNEATNLVWVVPISTEECNLKLEKGSDALLELFQSVNHPFIFTGDRQSYI